MSRQTLFKTLLQLLQQPTATTKPVGLAAVLKAEDWQAVTLLAVEQGLAPLLYHQLCKQQWQAFVPAASVQTLKQQYDQVLHQNLQICQDLYHLLETLQAHGIPVIVLKGAYLATAVYTQIALRPMNDIDLLVPIADLYRAAELVQGIGYEPMKPFSHQEELTQHHLPRFIRPDHASLELHWTITRPQASYSIDEGLLWQSARQVVLVGISTKSLALHDLVLHLCLHATYQHLFDQGIRFLCDISTILYRYQAELNWVELVARAQTFGWAPGVYITLALAQTLLNAPVPAEALAQLQPNDFNPQTLALFQSRLFREQFTAYRQLHEFSRFWESRSRSEQVRLLLQTGFPAPTVMSNIYGVDPHSPALYLYYCHRLWDVARRYCRIAWRRWRGDADLVLATKVNATLLKWSNDS